MQIYRLFVGNEKCAWADISANDSKEPYCVVIMTNPWDCSFALFSSSVVCIWSCTEVYYISTPKASSNGSCPLYKWHGRKLVRHGILAPDRLCHVLPRNWHKREPFAMYLLWSLQGSRRRKFVSWWVNVSWPVSLRCKCSPVSDSDQPVTIYISHAYRGIYIIYNFTYQTQK